MKIEEVQIGDLVVYSGKILKILYIIISLDDRYRNEASYLNSGTCVKVLNLGMKWAKKNLEHTNEKMVFPFAEYIGIKNLRKISKDEKF